MTAGSVLKQSGSLISGAQNSCFLVTIYYEDKLLILIVLKRIKLEVNEVQNKTTQEDKVIRDIGPVRCSVLCSTKIPLYSAGDIITILEE